TDTSRSRTQGGSGLGLSLVAAIAEAHNGQAWVSSKGLGEGTTFGIDIPAYLYFHPETESTEPTDAEPSKHGKIEDPAPEVHQVESNDHSTGDNRSELPQS
ncbi:MAG: hypothetical protein HKL81_01785, partial [Acidimicrobiaceae bacterium]|nr:hypothetical protein [Acidimicrobiaceae bacterium]